MQKIRILYLCLLTSLLIVPAGAIAAGVTFASCTVNTTAVSFGMYWGDVPLSSTGTITVSCNRPATTVVQLDNGQHVFAGFATRKMAATFPNKISYNLYTDPAHTNIWGDGTSGSLTVSGKNLTIYGQMPAGQTVTPGTYSDTVLVTVIW